MHAVYLLYLSCEAFVGCWERGRKIKGHLGVVFGGFSSGCGYFDRDRCLLFTAGINEPMDGLAHSVKISLCLCLRLPAIGSGKQSSEGAERWPDPSELCKGPAWF